MSDGVALTEKQKAHSFDRLIATHVIEWRTSIEHGVNKEMLVVEE
jgi:hypothetical protein